MIAALQSLDADSAAWLAQRDPSLRHLAAAMAAMGPRWALHDVQWSPGVRCGLAFVGPTRDGDTTFLAVHLDPSGWSRQDLCHDAALPGLPQASDPAFVARRLREVTGEAAVHCRVTPVRYRPGSRCVLRYDVLSGAGSTRYYAKVFAPHSFADTADRTIRVTAAAESAVRLPRVLAVWRDVAATVVSAVDGQSAAATLRDTEVPFPGRVHVATRLGALLADFHAVTGVTAPSYGTSDQLQALQGLLPAVRILNPTLADRFVTLLDALRRRTPGSQPTALTHGGFRPGQVVVDEAERLTLLDLDGACLGDPARDLASALSHLSWQAVRLPSQHDTSQQLSHALLSGYQQRCRAAIDPDSLTWWRAATLLQVGARRFRRLEVPDWALVPQLVDHAEKLLQPSMTGRTP